VAFRNHRRSAQHPDRVLGHRRFPAGENRRVDLEDDTRWYAVRSLFQIAGDESAYEERITLWRAAALEEAVDKASAEAAEYAEFAGSTHVADFHQTYEIADVPPRDGAEIFALTRDSALAPDAYVERFFETGTERQQ
jgi:hypothetical protein